MKIAEVMTRSVATCSRYETLNDAARIMWERDCGIVPVVDEGDRQRPVGAITDRDICIAAYTKGKPLVEMGIAEVMSPELVTCRAEDEVSEAEKTMQRAQVHRLVVVNDSDQLVGIVSLADIARAAARPSSTMGAISSREVGETVAAIRKPRPEVAAGV